jgi:hypothetical protein
MLSPSDANSLSRFLIVRIDTPSILAARVRFPRQNLRVSRIIAFDVREPAPDQRSCALASREQWLKIVSGVWARFRLGTNGLIRRRGGDLSLNRRVDRGVNWARRIEVEWLHDAKLD